MSALSRFEELVERIVEGSLVGLLGAPVQPVEMAKRLARAMEAERAIGVGRAIAPNDYTMYLNPDDFHSLASIQGPLERELEDYLREVARERRMSFLGRATVRLEPSRDLGRHQIRVVARLTDRPAPPGPDGDVAEHTQRLQPVSALPTEYPAKPASPARVAHRLVARSDTGSFPVSRPVVTLGRALDNDVVLEDARVSRYHAELRLRGDRYHLRDLRSTNGTLLNGKPVVEASLNPGDVISLGGLEFLFQATPGAGPSA